MKKLVFIFFVLLALEVPAQQLVTRNGYIGFFSKTPLENVKAENSQAVAAVDLSKQTLAFAVLVKGFLFTKELMQEHFNENYIESDKYPKATFNGTYTGTVDVTKPGTYNVNVKGALTLHGVTKNIEVPAAFQVQSGTLSGTSNFALKPQDFDINIPSLVREKIAQEISVAVQIAFHLTN